MCSSDLELFPGNFPGNLQPGNFELGESVFQGLEQDPGCGEGASVYSQGPLDGTYADFFPLGKEFLHHLMSGVDGLDESGMFVSVR